MCDYKERVVDEWASLAAKVIKLEEFIRFSTDFHVLPDEDREDMRIQLGYMKEYANCLLRRIKRWTA